MASFLDRFPSEMRADRSQARAIAAIKTLEEQRRSIGSGHAEGEEAAALRG
jgi:hypothetical protein